MLKQANIGFSCPSRRRSERLWRPNSEPAVNVLLVIGSDSDGELVMGFWSLFGKSLEISGRVMQAEGVDKWIASHGERLVEEKIVNISGKALGNKKLKKALVSRLQQPLSDRQFSERVNATWDEFLSAQGHICDLVFYAANDLSAGNLALLPSFFLNTSALRIVESEISNAEAFERLYPSPLLQDLFLMEWRRAIIAHMEETSQTVKKPLRIGRDFSIVGLDTQSFWSETHSKGSYYIYAGDASKLDRSRKKILEEKKENLDVIKGGASKGTIDTSVATFSEFMNAIDINPDWHKLKMSLINKRLIVPFKVR